MDRYKTEQNKHESHRCKNDNFIINIKRKDSQETWSFLIDIDIFQKNR